MARKKEEKSNLIRLVALGIGIFLLLRLFASFIPHTRSWGINQAAFTKGMPLLYLLGLAVVLIIYLYGKGKSAKDNLYFPFKTVYPYLIFIVAGLAFIFLDVKSHFLGDGYTLISGMSVPNPFLIPEAYGELKIHQLYQQLFGTGQKIDSYLAFKNLSIISGLIFIGGLLYYGRKLTSTTLSYYIFILLNFFSAITILFFGYVETYSITMAFLYLFFLSALASLKNKKRAITPIIFLLAAIFLHRIGIAYLPLLVLYLLLVFSGAKIRKDLTDKARLILISVGIGIVLLYILIMISGVAYWKRIFLPPFGDTYTMDGYYLFSLPHILDYINLLFFLIPIALLLLWLSRFHLSSNSESDNRLTLFLGATMALGLIVAFLFDPKLGMAKDWDLMSTMLVGVIIGASYLWVNKFRKISGFAAASIMVIIMQISVFVPWFAIHETLSLYSYNLEIMKLDPKHNWAGFSTVIGLSRELGLKSESTRLYRYYETEFPEATLNKRGRDLEKNNDYAGALKLYDQAISMNPAYHPVYVPKARCLIELGKPEAALEALDVSQYLSPYNSDLYYYRGFAYKNLGKSNPAYKNWVTSLKYDANNYKTISGLGRYFYEIASYDSAVIYIRKIPDSLLDNDTRCLYGEIKLKTGDTAGARELLEKCDSVSHIGAR
jgi:hypothetical protein